MYIYKLHDSTNIQISRAENQQGQQEIVWGEIKQFLAPESCWRVLKYPLFPISPGPRLPVHLPQEKSVYFQPRLEDRVVLSAASELMTTAWFKLNQNHESASTSILKFRIISASVTTIEVGGSKERKG